MNNRMIKIAMVLGLTAATLAAQAKVLPEFMNAQQLTAWRAQHAALVVAAMRAPDEQPQFFTGKPYDSASGLYLFKYRAYSPCLARWTSPDPSGFPDGANNSLYVNNNVDETIDANGLAVIPGTYSTPKSMLDRDISVPDSVYMSALTLAFKSSTTASGLVMSSLIAQLSASLNKSSASEVYFQMLGSSTVSADGSWSGENIVLSKATVKSATIGFSTVLGAAAGVLVGAPVGVSGSIKITDEVSYSANQLNIFGQSPEFECIGAPLTVSVSLEVTLSAQCALLTGSSFTGSSLYQGPSYQTWIYSKSKTSE